LIYKALDVKKTSVWHLSVWRLSVCLSVCRIHWPKSRTERPIRLKLTQL